MRSRSTAAAMTRFVAMWPGGVGSGGRRSFRWNMPQGSERSATSGTSGWTFPGASASGRAVGHVGLLLLPLRRGGADGTDRGGPVRNGRSPELLRAVPRELWWDNPTTIATTILRGRQREFNTRYLALASHYRFQPWCCMPARGNEKSFVENRVRNLQRRWATPVPKMADLAELNAHLRRCCLRDRQRVASGQTETIGQRFERERQAALELPQRGFDPCLSEPRQVDKYQTVLFDGNRYSVPRHWAFQWSPSRATWIE